MTISKLIIPAAGLGSRFLPITKAVPKEMLPILNKPAIEYIVQEAIDASINEICMILSPDKNSIINYFSKKPQLENLLKEENKEKLLSSIDKIIEIGKFSYIIQNKAAGLANALLYAKPLIEKNSFFGVALPDDIIFSTEPEIYNLAKIAKQENCMVIAVQEIPTNKISAYGVIAPKKEISKNCFEIESLVEKPSAEDAPSNLAIVGRYIFHTSLFEFIPKTIPRNNEILLPDTINLMIKSGIKVCAVKINGERFDTGNTEGWIDANKKALLNL